MLSISASIKHKDFEETIRNLPSFGERDISHNHPYATLWYFMITKYWIEIASMGHQFPTDFIFDEQIGFTESALRSWNKARAACLEHPNFPDQVIGSPPIFQDDKKFPPIQAADLLAWCIRRKLTSDDLGKKLPEEARLNILEIPAMHLDMPRSFLERKYVEYVSIAVEEARKNPKLKAKYFYD